jgi:hypothetical protein
MEINEPFSAIAGTTSSFYRESTGGSVTFAQERAFIMSLYVDSDFTTGNCNTPTILAESDINADWADVTLSVSYSLLPAFNDYSGSITGLDTNPSYSSSTESDYLDKSMNPCRIGYYYQ